MSALQQLSFFDVFDKAIPVEPVSALVTTKGSELTDMVQMYLSNCSSTVGFLEKTYTSTVDPALFKSHFVISIASGEDSDSGPVFKKRGNGAVINIVLDYWLNFESDLSVDWLWIASEFCDGHELELINSHIPCIEYVSRSVVEKVDTLPLSLPEPEPVVSIAAANSQVSFKKQMLESGLTELLEASRIDGLNVYLPEKLPRADYLKINEALNSLGGVWNKKAKCHVFDADPLDAIENLILTGSYTRKKDSDFDYFPTPSNIVLDMLNIASISNDDVVLEPSAGNGHIARLIRESAPGCDLQVIELVESRALALSADGFNLVGRDFLEFNPGPVFSKAVMNPPFSKQADIDHVVHAFSLLQSGGVLVAVMGAGIQFRTNSKTLQFLSLLKESSGSIQEIAEGAFKESGTMVNTVMVTMIKP